MAPQSPDMWLQGGVDYRSGFSAAIAGVGAGQHQGLEKDSRGEIVLCRTRDRFLYLPPDFYEISRRPTVRLRALRPPGRRASRFTQISQLLITTSTSAAVTLLLLYFAAAVKSNADNSYKKPLPSFVLAANFGPSSEMAELAGLFEQVRMVLPSGPTLPEIIDPQTKNRPTPPLPPANREQVQRVHSIIKNIHPRHTSAPQIAHTIVSLANELEYDPLLVAAVINAESTFNARAISPVGARGLMQVMPATAEFISRAENIGWRGVATLYEPYYNVRLGITYLKYLEGLFNGDMQKVLIAYNWGPGNLNRALRGELRIPSGPQRYATKVLQDHRRWKMMMATNAPDDGVRRVRG